MINNENKRLDKETELVKLSHHEKMAEIKEANFKQIDQERVKHEKALDLAKHKFEREMAKLNA